MTGIRLAVVSYGRSEIICDDKAWKFALGASKVIDQIEFVGGGHNFRANDFCRIDRGYRNRRGNTDCDAYQGFDTRDSRVETIHLYGLDVDVVRKCD